MKACSSRGLIPKWTIGSIIILIQSETEILPRAKTSIGQGDWCQTDLSKGTKEKHMFHSFNTQSQRGQQQKAGSSEPSAKASRDWTGSAFQQSLQRKCLIRSRIFNLQKTFHSAGMRILSGGVRTLMTSKKALLKVNLWEDVQFQRAESEDSGVVGGRVELLLQSL